MKKLDALAAILVLVGGLNWGLVAVAELDLVAWICGGLEFRETNAAGRLRPRRASGRLRHRLAARRIPPVGHAGRGGRRQLTINLETKEWK